MPHAPLLWPSVATLPGEAAAIKDLNAHLVGLEYSVQAWEAALALYETSKNPPPTVSRAVARRWGFIACNECILELYHLRARLERIQSVRLRHCPSVRALVDMSKVKDARKLLDESFPDIEVLRHATAHKGENEAYPEVHAPDGQYALSGFHEPDRFSVPYKGQLVYLDITTQSLERISEVVTTFFAAFEPVAASLQQQGHLE